MMIISQLLNAARKYRHKRIERAIRRHFSVGDNTYLMPGVGIDIRTPRDICGSIGRDCVLSCNFIFESDQGHITIGDRTFINGNTQIISRNKIEIGSDVTIAWGVYIYDHNSHSLDHEDRIDDQKTLLKALSKEGGINDLWTMKDWSTVRSAPIKICDKAWIGFNSIILKGVTIGEGAVVGAASVVAHDVPPYTVVAGNPARIVKTL